MNQPFDHIPQHTLGRTRPEDEGSVDVLAVSGSDGLVRLEWPDEVRLRRHHDPRTLAAALRRTGGFARWQPRRRVLAVPSGPGRNLLFHLVETGDAADCAVRRDDGAGRAAGDPTFPATDLALE